MPALTPLALNPVPEGVTAETVTLEFPVLVTVTGKELVLPRLTLPKLRVVGLALRRKVAAIPVPLKGIANGEFVALLTRERAPVSDPGEAGVNNTEKVVLWPAARVLGTGSPEMLKPAPETAA